MARRRVLRGHFGPRLSREVPSRSPNHMIAKMANVESILVFIFWLSPGIGTHCAVTRRHSRQHDLALLRSNSRGGGSVIRGSQHENLRADRGAVVQIDNIVVGQTNAAG